MSVSQQRDTVVPAVAGDTGPVRTAEGRSRLWWVLGSTAAASAVPRGRAVIARLRQAVLTAGP